VMRGAVMACAAQARLEVHEAPLVRADIEAAQEIFLTNARIGIWPVRRIEQRVLGPGPLTRALRTQLQPLLEGAAGA
jgi:branched-subunit amino acid aminotransferase/4-amino-4-deoxychorismate lyase